MKKELLWSIIIGVLSLILGQGFFSRLYFSPNMSYEVLSVHRIDSQETQSVLIKNNGRSLLHNVVISIKSNRPILKIRLEGPEIMDSTGSVYIISGNTGEKSIQLRLDRLVRKSTYTLTMLIEKDSIIDIMAVSDETDARKEVPRTRMGFMDYLLVFIAACLMGLGTFLLFRFRRLVSSRYCLSQRQKSGNYLKSILDDHVYSLAKVKEILEKAKNQYDQKDVVINAMQDIQRIIEKQIDIFKNFSESIIIDGICFDSTRKSEKE